MGTYLNEEELQKIFKHHIKSTSFPVSIKTLFGDRYTRKIKYDPYYQRNYVWDKGKASFFIESILLGTDIPPLIFFNNGSKIEVIDGRQRFETMKKFRSGDLKLSIKGLTQLTQLAGKTFATLDTDIQDLFDDTKIRIFEFEIVNEPKLDGNTEDKVKKEIFRRYNSGITPLNRAELDNATYDDDDITNTLKNILSKDKNLNQEIIYKFLGDNNNSDSAKLLAFLRKYLVLSSFPINSYASGLARTETLNLLYTVKSENTEDIDNLCKVMIDNLKLAIYLIDELQKQNFHSNRLINECLLWVVFILKEEDKDTDILFHSDNIKKLTTYLNNNLEDFDTQKSHFYKPIVQRYKSIAKIIKEISKFDFNLYFKNDEFKSKIKELKQTEKDAKLKLEELDILRISKPDPAQIPIDEIVGELYSNKYLVRPSYQRQEKINIIKASAIIESIILGISLPPIFIFKNENKVKEVVDGQQRLLSILGFMGKKYLDENGEYIVPKNFSFKLRKLKILTELNGKTYSDLSEVHQDKILDFKISLIEIDAKLNKGFDPVDLFIRLNSKPYPIKENSFEMWNSFMEREVIERIRTLTDKYIEWFFITKRSAITSDRMKNEELVSLLSYIHYKKVVDNDDTILGFYGRDSKINCRIKEKKGVTQLLEDISSDINKKEAFLSSIDSIEKFILAIQKRLDTRDLKKSMDNLLKQEESITKRYLVDFYILFQILQRFSNTQLEDFTYEELKNKIVTIQLELKEPSSRIEDDKTQEYFNLLLNKVSS